MRKKYFEHFTTAATTATEAGDNGRRARAQKQPLRRTSSPSGMVRASGNVLQRKKGILRVPLLMMRLLQLLLCL